MIAIYLMDSMNKNSDEGGYLNFLEDFKDVDWDTVDNDKVVGNYIPMPDGSLHYIEMSMLHWYWAYFYVVELKSGLEYFARNALEVKAANKSGEEGLSFDELVRHGLMVFGKQWVKETTGRG